jgi:hypothetical protein
MLVPISLAVPSIAAVGTRRPQPEEVRGIIVTPPREARVAVRVEVVTEDEQRPQPPAANEVPPPSYEAALYAANLEASMEAAQLGATDLRRAAAAYSASSDWRGGSASGYGGAREGREPPRYLDVRA